MTFLLILAAIICGALGMVLLSTATYGVGLICLGCLAGILARLRQAQFNQKELLNALGYEKPKAVAPEGPKPNLGKLVGKG